MYVHDPDDCTYRQWEGRRECTYLQYMTTGRSRQISREGYGYWNKGTTGIPLLNNSNNSITNKQSKCNAGSIKYRCGYLYTMNVVTYKSDHSNHLHRDLSTASVR
jgi:hypothetical protein